MKDIDIIFEEILFDLDSPVESIRQDAIIKLSKIDSPKVIPVLESIAREDGDPHFRFLAEKLLFQIKRKTLTTLSQASTKSEEETIKPLIEKLQKGNSDEKIDTIRKIVRLQDKSYSKILKEVLGVEKDNRVIATLLLALGILGEKADLPLIYTYFAHIDERVRANAIEAASYIPDPKTYEKIIPLIRDKNNRVRANAIKFLRMSGKVNVMEILKNMLTGNDIYMKESAVYALKFFPIEQILPLLEIAINDPDPVISKKAKMILAIFANAGNVEASQLLKTGKLAKTTEEEIEKNDFSVQKSIKALNSPDESVRKKEIDRIIRERDEVMVPELIKRLDREHSNHIIARILIGLGKLKAISADSKIVRYLGHSDSRIRANAVEALSLMGSRKYLLELQELLRDKNNRVRANAVIALKDEPEVNIFKILRLMVKSPDESMRKSAFYAICEINKEDGVKLLTEFLNSDNNEEKKRVIEILEIMAEKGNKAAAKLIERKIKPLSAVENTITTEQQEIEIEEEEQKQTESATDLNSLKKVLENGDVVKRKEVVYKLKEIATPEAISLLEKLGSSDKSFAVRYLAQTMLDSLKSSSSPQEESVEQSDTPTEKNGENILQNNSTLAETETLTEKKPVEDSLDQIIKEVQSPKIPSKKQKQEDPLKPNPFYRFNVFFAEAIPIHLMCIFSLLPEKLLPFNIVFSAITMSMLWFLVKDGGIFLKGFRKNFHLEVVDFKTNKPASLFQSIKRNFFLIIPAIPIFEAAFAFSDEHQRRFGDKLANTRVIQKKRTNAKISFILFIIFFLLYIFETGTILFKGSINIFGESNTIYNPNLKVKLKLINKKSWEITPDSEKINIHKILSNGKIIRLKISSFSITAKDIKEIKSTSKIDYFRDYLMDYFLRKQVMWEEINANEITIDEFPAVEFALQAKFSNNYPERGYMTFILLSEIKKVYLIEYMVPAEKFSMVMNDYKFIKKHLKVNY